jgi:Fe-S-cluster containining protein
MVETFYLHLEFTNKKGAWSVNLPFLCSKCGVCCTLDDFLTAGEVNAKPEEIPKVHAKLKALFEMLGKIFETGEAKYEQYIMQNPCPFLVDKSCSIYEIRPVGCRLFPNTSFGMLTQNCEALNRFKKMRSILKKGKTSKETFSQITNGFITPARFSEKQFQKCIAKLRQTGATDDELVLFKQINSENKFQV